MGLGVPDFMIRVDELAVILWSPGEYSGWPKGSAKIVKTVPQQ